MVTGGSGNRLYPLMFYKTVFGQFLNILRDHFHKLLKQIKRQRYEFPNRFKIVMVGKAS